MINRFIQRHLNDNSHQASGWIDIDTLAELVASEFGMAIARAEEYVSDYLEENGL